MFTLSAPLREGGSVLLMVGDRTVRTGSFTIRCSNITCSGTCITVEADRGVAHVFHSEELEEDQHERNLSLRARKEHSPPSAWSRTKRTAIHTSFLTMMWSCDEGKAEVASVRRL